MRPLNVLFALAACLPAADLAAQELRWHVGLGVAGELDDRGPPPGGPVDADPVGTLLVGATFDSGFGLEAAYADLGRLAVPGIADGGYDVEGELVSVGASWRWALDDFAPYAKLGWFSREEDGVAITVAGPRPLRLDDDGALAELGLRWHVTEPFVLRAAWTHYDFETGADGSAQLVGEWHF